MKRERVSSSEARRIAELESRFGSRTLRTILSPEGSRIMRGDRLANLTGGSGRLTEVEKDRLARVSANAQQIDYLQGKGQRRGNVEWKNNRALRDWVAHGKERDAPRRDNRDRELKAIRSLRYFGIAPSAGGGYVRKASK
jgi:hypothetical protein